VLFGHRDAAHPTDSPWIRPRLTHAEATQGTVGRPIDPLVHWRGGIGGKNERS
jgi:hypothetical protein